MGSVDIVPTIWLVVLILLITWTNNAESNTRICTHCCDEVYPKNGTPIYYMTMGPKGDKGDTGPIGLQGQKLDQGIPGPNGTKGLAGPKGDKGERGEAAPLTPRSAFSVARSSPLMGNETTQLPVTFDKVFVNLGDQFDIENGRFICEYPGVYNFAYTVQSYLNKFVGVQLMKNEEEQVILYANTIPRRIMQSQTILLQLLKSDIVWLRQAKGSRFAIYGNTDLQITFNGYLLFPDTD